MNKGFDEEELSKKLEVLQVCRGFFIPLYQL